jgi:hypothetical protein
MSELNNILEINIPTKQTATTADNLSANITNHYFEEAQ